MFGWDSHCLSAAISLWVIDSILQQNHKHQVIIYAWAESVHSESHTSPRGKNTEAKTEIPTENGYSNSSLMFFCLFFLMHNIYLHWLSMLPLNFVLSSVLHIQALLCSAHLRLMILTAYSWPLCLCLHFLQTEKLPSPSGGPWRPSS